MKRILTDDQDALLGSERRLLSDVRAALAGNDPGGEAEVTLGRAIAQLDELFLLVVAGEFNAGKSALINALLGAAVLEEGVTPTTADVDILRHGDPKGRTFVEEHLYAVTAPVDILRHIHVVDTPGTNAIMREHQEITERFLPRADMVLFVTAADRPFTETERGFLDRIRSWGKKVVIAINRIDVLANDSDVDRVQAFVSSNATRLLGETPEVFPVSARLALRAKSGEPSVWQGSRFDALERYVRERLDAGNQFRIKLLAALAVADVLLDRQLAGAAARLEILHGDLQVLEDARRQRQAYRADMARDVEFRMADIEKVLVEMEQRGHGYVDETMRIGRVLDLMNRNRIREEFEQKVVGDAPQQVERKVGELIHWMVEADRTQWQAVTEHLAERRRQHHDRIVGSEGSARFHADRASVIDSVVREAQRVVDTYDRFHEAHVLAEGFRNAVAASAAIGAGAVGLGTLVAMVATTAAADVTGILMAGVMAAIGFLILPAKRRRAKEEMRAKITAVRENLIRTLKAQFEREMASGRERLDSAIAPYSRFVQAENEKLTGTRATLDDFRQKSGSLRAAIAREQQLNGAGS